MDSIYFLLWVIIQYFFIYFHTQTIPALAIGSFLVGSYIPSTSFLPPSFPPPLPPFSPCISLSTLPYFLAQKSSAGSALIFDALVLESTLSLSTFPPFIGNEELGIKNAHCF